MEIVLKEFNIIYQNIMKDLQIHYSEQFIKQFDEIVSLIKKTRNNIIRVANTALIDLYWNIGKYISVKLASSEWGDGIVKQLSEYITNVYPELKGFSQKNLWRMKQFYDTYSLCDEFISPLVRQISWTNNIIIMSRTKSLEEKEFYLRLCISEKYSKRELERQISSALYERTILSSPKVSTQMKQIIPDSNRLFKDKDDEVVEYALNRSLSPTMVAEYQLCLPNKELLQKKLREIYEEYI